MADRIHGSEEAQAASLYFLGCNGGLGHFYWNPKNRRDITKPDGCPWKSLDSKDSVPSRSTAQGAAKLRHEGGWTSLGCHDYTVDRRPGSIAVFFCEGTYGFEEMLTLARRTWPQVVDRVGPVVLVEDLYRNVEVVSRRRYVTDWQPVEPQP